MRESPLVSGRIRAALFSRIKPCGEDLKGRAGRSERLNIAMPERKTNAANIIKKWFSLNLTISLGYLCTI
jgi:hypothetical protein